MDDLEEKVAGHYAELNVCMLGNSLEACQETEDDGEKCHEDSKQNGGEDTTDDSNDGRGEITKPTEPAVGRAQLFDVRQTADERNRDRPEDNLKGCG